MNGSNCTVAVWEFCGMNIVAEDGSQVHAVTPGESLDTSDKGTAKAMSVAYRIALLQIFALPTQEPTTDPDSEYHTR